MIYPVLFLCFLFFPHVNGQYAALPRWGQASLLLGNSLIIYGGKTDPSGGQTYSSAPTNCDVLHLDLSESFQTSSTPWQLVNSANNASSVQGPSVAWHTLSAFNTSHALVFGGVPDPDGEPPLFNRADSAAIFDAFDPLAPEFSVQPSDWASQPTRRTHHSAVSAPDGQVYIIGGERPHNDDFAYSDNFRFSIDPPSFSRLPSGLPDLTGHCSVVLPNGYILVLGGYSPSRHAMTDFSSIYVLDPTKSSLSWTTISTTGTIPDSRRGFACTVFDSNRLYIHGGSDSDRLRVFSDGWVLDLSRDTWTWSPVPALSELGARTDHFAVSFGREIIFGFGYESFTPAPATLALFLPTVSAGSGSGSAPFEFSGGTWTDTHSPPEPDGNGGQPVPTQTVPPHSPGTTSTYTGIGGSSGVLPTTTSPPDEDEESSPPSGPSTGRTVGIAIGAAVALLMLIAVLLIVTRRVNQRREARRQFLALSGGDDDLGPPSGIAVAAPTREKNTNERTLFRDDPTQGGLYRDIIVALGIPALAATIARVVGTSSVVPPERRDMLADEDVRDFSVGAWYDSHRREGTGGSSWSLRHIFPGRMRREGSAVSSVATSPNEKSDPFEDHVVGVGDIENVPSTTVPMAAAALGASRVYSGRRQNSLASSVNPHDPFADPQPHVYGNIHSSAYHHHCQESSSSAVTTDELEPWNTIRRIPPPTSHLNTHLPLSDDAHPLSTLSEVSSQGTIAIPSSSSNHSHFDISSDQNPFEAPSSSNDHSTPLTSKSSIPASPHSPKNTSAPLSPANMMFVSSQLPNVKRTDTWWARFSKTPLTRRSVDDNRGDIATSSASIPFEFKDPTPPPPRLDAIAESSTSTSTLPAQVTNASTSFNDPVYMMRAEPVKKTIEHGRSVSSFKTVDTAAIERMGGMDVVQRVPTASIRTRESTGSYDIPSRSSSLHRPLSEELGLWIPPTSQGHNEMVASPTEGADSNVPRGYSSSPSPVPSSQPPPEEMQHPEPPRKQTRPPSSGAVAARVQAYEKRLSMDQSPAPRKPDDRRTSRPTYGLAPKASLYVANPDRKHGSGDS